MHPKKAFIIDAFDKEIRLSFAQRIKGTLPEPYQALIPLEKEKDTPDFKFDDESTPFASQGKEIAQLVRRKAANEEFTPILDSIEKAAAESGLPNPKIASTDALVTSICWVGSKSLSHMLACIERCKERLTDIATTSGDNGAETKQIITSVIEYWRYQAGVGVTIVDKLLNYQVLSPSTVIEWALVDNVQRGTLLSKAWCYELVSGTVHKLAGRVREVVQTIRKPELDDTQRAELKKVLDHEMQAMKNLITMILDSVASVRDGNQDQMMETSDALRMEDEDLIKAWGGKWARAFQRRLAVAESWVREELAKPIPPAPPALNAEADAMQQNDGEMNGDDRDDTV